MLFIVFVFHSKTSAEPFNKLTGVTSGIGRQLGRDLPYKE